MFESRPPAHPGEQILIVDAHSDASTSLQQFLQLLGYRAEVVEHDEDGIRRAVADRPEVAIIELNPPNDVGFEVARRLRAEVGREILLVAYSAYEVSLAHRVRAAGFDYVVVKGHNPYELIRWLEAQAVTRDG
jgi:DNA-binding response OmpR family regulator